MELVDTDGRNSFYLEQELARYCEKKEREGEKEKRSQERQVNWLNQGCLASGKVSNISRYASARRVRPRLSVPCQWLTGAGAPLKTVGVPAAVAKVNSIQCSPSYIRFAVERVR